MADRNFQKKKRSDAISPQMYLIAFEDDKPYNKSINIFCEDITYGQSFNKRKQKYIS